MTNGAMDQHEHDEHTRREPFKFLDSYTPDDRDIFFGREEEIENIYNRFYRKRILVVYGKSGTGKTSVINCGLISRIPPEDLYVISIRGGHRPYDNLISGLQKHTGGQQDNTLDLVESVYSATFKPIVIIFDQFEELFTIASKDQREKFILELQKLNETRMAIDLILIIREEFLADLTDLEKYLPELFDNRFRIEKMTRTQAIEAITEPCKQCGIGLEEGLPGTIVDNLIARSGEVDLPDMQILLDRLYRTALKDDDENITISGKHLEKIGSFDRVLEDFLEEQLSLMKDKETGKKVLFALVSGEGTKIPLTIDEISERTSHLNLSKSELQKIINHLIDVRILNERNEEGAYELKHDSLARIVFNIIPVEEHKIRELKEVIRPYIKKAMLLEESILSEVQPFEKYLVHDPDYAKIIRESKYELERKKKRRKTIATAVISTVITLLTLSTILFLVLLAQSRKANRHLEKAKAERSKLIQEITKQNKNLEYLVQEKELYIKMLNENLKELDESNQSVSNLDNINQEIKTKLDEYRYLYEQSQDEVTTLEKKKSELEQELEVAKENLDNQAQEELEESLIEIKALEKSIEEKMVWVEGGTFEMGSRKKDDEKPPHEVKLSSFYMDKYEVTVGEFRRFCEATNNTMPDQPDSYTWNENFPVVNVTWKMAKKYCTWAGKRLPTEAEFEFASKGGRLSRGHIFSGSDKPDEIAWHAYNASGHPHPVGSKKPNELGLYDLTGNVWEWCFDRYTENYYRKSPYENPRGPMGDDFLWRVARGGSFVSAPGENLQNTTRYKHFEMATRGLHSTGFRCVKDAE